MDRRWRASLAILAASIAFTGIACRVAPEEKIVKDFFRASRLRDDATLGTFATASFDVRRQGQVERLGLVSVGPERGTPLPLKQYAQAVDDARAAQNAFAQEKLTYQHANIRAIERIEQAEAKKQPIPRQDANVHAAWSKWRDDAAVRAKAVSDARARLNSVKALAELSLSQPNGPTPDVTQMNGELVEKDVTVNATVRTAEGQTQEKVLVVTLERAVMKEGQDESRRGRWIVTGVREAQQRQTS